MAYDGTASSNVATVQININPANDPPVAVDDYISGVEDITLVITGTGVLTNDYDIDGDPLGAILDTPPAFGVADLGIDGSLVYTPALDFSGVDSFTYHAFDGLENSNIATLVITITAANDPKSGGGLKECPIRDCAIQRQVTKCSECSDQESCERFNIIMQGYPGCKIYLHRYSFRSNL